MNKLINIKSPRKSSKNPKSPRNNQEERYFATFSNSILEIYFISNTNAGSNNTSTSAEAVASIPHVPIMSRKLTLRIKGASKLGILSALTLECLFDF